MRRMQSTNELFVRSVNHGGPPHPLEEAARNGDLPTVRTILAESPFFLDARFGEKCRTITMLACERGHMPVVKYLLDQKASLTECDVEGGDALMSAAANGHAAIVDFLLRHNAPLTTTMKNGRSAMFLACLGRHDAIVETLLGHKADPNAGKRESALSLATSMGLRHLVGVLLEAKANPNTAVQGHHPLHDALSHGQMSIALQLLQAKASIASVKDNGLILALEHGRADIAKLMISAKVNIHACNSDKDTALALALKHGMQDVANMLVLSRADVNAVNGYGESVLLAAIESGSSGLVEAMIDHKVSVSQLKPQRRGDVLQMACRHGFPRLVAKCLKEKTWATIADDAKATALVQACRNGHEELVRALLQLGVPPRATVHDVSAYSDRNHPLFAALLSGVPSIVALLVAHGAMVEDVTVQALNTALIGGVKSNNCDMVELALELGADANAVDDIEKTALMVAAACDAVPIMNVLLRAGASIEHRHPLVGTALTYAILTHKDAAATWLLLSGADPLATDPSGASALALAQARGVEPLTRALRMRARGDSLDACARVLQNAQGLSPEIFATPALPSPVVASIGGTAHVATTSTATVPLIVATPGIVPSTIMVGTSSIAADAEHGAGHRRATITEATAPATAATITTVPCAPASAPADASAVAVPLPVHTGKADVAEYAGAAVRVSPSQAHAQEELPWLGSMMESSELIVTSLYAASNGPARVADAHAATTRSPDTASASSSKADAARASASARDGAASSPSHDSASAAALADGSASYASPHPSSRDSPLFGSAGVHLRAPRLAVVVAHDHDNSASSPADYLHLPHSLSPSRMTASGAASPANTHFLASPRATMSPCQSVASPMHSDAVFSESTAFGGQLHVDTTLFTDAVDAEVSPWASASSPWIGPRSIANLPSLPDCDSDYDTHASSLEPSPATIGFRGAAYGPSATLTLSTTLSAAHSSTTLISAPNSTLAHITSSTATATATPAGAGAGAAYDRDGRASRAVSGAMAAGETFSPWAHAESPAIRASSPAPVVQIELLTTVPDSRSMGVVPDYDKREARAAAGQSAGDKAQHVPFPSHIYDLTSAPMVPTGATNTVPSTVLVKGLNPLSPRAADGEEPLAKPVIRRRGSAAFTFDQEVLSMPWTAPLTYPSARLSVALEPMSAAVSPMATAPPRPSRPTSTFSTSSVASDDSKAPLPGLTPMAPPAVVGLTAVRTSSQHSTREAVSEKEVHPSLLGRTASGMSAQSKADVPRAHTLDRDGGHASLRGADRDSVHPSLRGHDRDSTHPSVRGYERDVVHPSLYGPVGAGRGSPEGHTDNMLLRTQSDASGNARGGNAFTAAPALVPAPAPAVTTASATTSAIAAAPSALSEPRVDMYGRRRSGAIISLSAGDIAAFDISDPSSIPIAAAATPTDSHRTFAPADSAASSRLPIPPPPAARSPALPLRTIAPASPAPPARMLGTPPKKTRSMGTPPPRLARPTSIPSPFATAASPTASALPLPPRTARSGPSPNQTAHADQSTLPVPAPTSASVPASASVPTKAPSPASLAFSLTAPPSLDELHLYESTRRAHDITAGNTVAALDVPQFLDIAPDFAPKPRGSFPEPLDTASPSCASDTFSFTSPTPSLEAARARPPGDGSPLLASRSSASVQGSRGRTPSFAAHTTTPSVITRILEKRYSVASTPSTPVFSSTAIAFARTAPVSINSPGAVGGAHSGAGVGAPFTRHTRALSMVCGDMGLSSPSNSVGGSCDLNSLPAFHNLVSVISGVGVDIGLSPLHCLAADDDSDTEADGNHDHENGGNTKPRSKGNRSVPSSVRASSSVPPGYGRPRLSSVVEGGNEGAWTGAATEGLPTWEEEEEEEEDVEVTTMAFPM